MEESRTLKKGISLEKREKKIGRDMRELGKERKKIVWVLIFFWFVVI
jgi:hypothetical protein